MSYLFNVRTTEYELQEIAVIKCREMTKLKVVIELILNLHQFVKCDRSMKYYSVQVLLNGTHNCSCSTSNVKYQT